MPKLPASAAFDGKLAAKPAYNERLFRGDALRSFYHLARFKWAKSEVMRLGLRDLRLVELGCFDGRLVDELGPAVTEFVGLDANWECGLDLARKKFVGRPDITLIEAAEPSPLRNYPDGYFNAAAALETIEHVPPEMVDDYLKELARVTHGYFLVTVPNEIGPVFLLKHLGKSLFYRDARPHTLKEVAAATFLRSDLVERREHKGFDYRKLIREIEQYFDVVNIAGLASLSLPPILSPTVAILARSK